MQHVSTCLWFNNQAEEAVAFYVSLFPNSGILHTTYYLDGTPTPAGSVLTVRFWRSSIVCPIPAASRALFSGNCMPRSRSRPAT